MKISIVTVCFNSAKTVADTLASIRDQRHENFEIEHIVVDGLSKDSTVDIIKEGAVLARAVGIEYRWLSEKDEGLYDAMNKGMKMATGDVIGILNSDDMMNAPDALEKVVKAAQDGTEVLYACVRFVKEETKYVDLQSTSSYRYIWPRLWRPWMESWGWTPPHPGLYIRKSAYEKYGYYRADCEISADDEIIMRLVRKCGASAKYLPACTVAMRLGGKSTQVKNLILQNRELVNFNKDNGYWCCLPMMFPKMAIKALEILIPKVCHLFGMMV